MLELFWQGLASIRPETVPPGVLPLVGVPILNGLEHLQRLLASLDVPIGILAIVDQSGGRTDPQAVELRRSLRALEQQGRPGINQIRVARPFANAGVAAAWNQILLSFPQAPLALIVNHDVVFPPGVLAEALSRLDATRPQYLSLFPGERAFSAFALTALAWDAVGRFDERYYPAYCEDLGACWPSTQTKAAPSPTIRSWRVRTSAAFSSIGSGIPSGVVDRVAAP